MKAAVILGIVAAFSAHAADANWRAYETPHFVIYSESEVARVDDLATRLENYDKLMRMATGTEEDQPVKVRIYEVESTDDVETAIGQNGSGIAGFYDSNSLGPYLVTPRKTSRAGRYFTPELVLQHEYAHHFMLQYFPAIYPTWYVEGFAELVGSSMPMDDGRIGYGMPAKHRGHDILAYWVPLQELLTKEKVIYLDTYGEGWAVTHFLTFDDERSQQLREYLTALRHGKSMAEAAEAFGDLGKLNSDARRYVGAGSFPYRPVKVEIQHPVLQKSRNLSAAEAALIPEVIAFRDDDLSAIKSSSYRAREEKLRQDNLEKIREITARYPNDPAALHFLAVAERTAGNRDQALAAANRLLAVQPGNKGGMVEKSLDLSALAGSLSGPRKDATAKEARALAIKANSADPDDPLPLIAYYQSYNLTGARPPAIAVKGLVKAVNLLPRDTSTRQLLVDRLAADRNWRAAIAVLQPIANSPHDSPLRTAAREQMERLQAQLAAAPPPAETKAGS
jgi:tetratricopeptide (TPR) repeat protein